MRFRAFLLLFVAGAACSSREAAENGTSSSAAEAVVASCTSVNTSGDPNAERYGTSCICCHSGEFGVAGSLAHDAGVATILVEDHDGKTAEMSPDPYDNFFRHRPLSPPLSATVIFENGERRTMKGPAPHGSCNACHDSELVPRIGTR